MCGVPLRESFFRKPFLSPVELSVPLPLVRLCGPQDTGALLQQIDRNHKNCRLMSRAHRISVASLVDSERPCGKIESCAILDKVTKLPPMKKTILEQHFDQEY
ncbi:hypothetical protein TNCV_3223461 [Trichonephila clavipes]|nr:hypothetical protein TNCV_3223461 [Trichonephila clavipes]